MNAGIEKIFGLLTICRKAGRMVMGFDLVKEAIMTGKAKAVFLATDISAKTEKEIRFFAQRKNIEVHSLGADISEIGSATGKNAAVIGICDDGFAKKLICLTEENS